MNNYKIYKDSWSIVKRFETMEEAQSWATSYGQGYFVEDLGATPLKDPEQLYESDVFFLKNLFNQFNVKNRIQPQTPTEMAELQTAFGNIALLADAGSVAYVRASIAALVTPIGGVYTSVRQTEDLTEIDNYIATRLYK